MPFLTTEQKNAIKEKMCFEASELQKLFKKEKSVHYLTKSVHVNRLQEYIDDGYEEVVTKKASKSTVRVRKLKDCGTLFEDDVWSQFYKLGLAGSVDVERHITAMNKDRKLEVRWGNGELEHKQLDVVAVSKDCIFVVECKSAERRKSASGFKELADAFRLQKSGLEQALKDTFGKDKKVKFIFATRNYIFPEESDDLQRFKEMQFFIYNDNTFNYIESLVKSYKEYAWTQVMAIYFRGERISKDNLSIPALQGKMGKQTYYMFSIEPQTLLRISYIQHRTKVNDDKAYQRLLKPDRLKNITSFINEGGYFPNSIIINFSNKSGKNKVTFQQSSSKDSDSESKHGRLLIPNAYGIAFVIDGQHRLYGYAASPYKSTNTIPVVAFEGLDADTQLKMFVDINENQKSVPKSLVLDLAEDLLWGAPRLDSRLKALRSSIIKDLSSDTSSVLYEMIGYGNETAPLSMTSFDNALSTSKMLPKVRINSYVNQDDNKYSIYNTSANPVKQEEITKIMDTAKADISSFLKECYSYLFTDYKDVFEGRYIVTNRGTVPFILLIDSINKHLTDKGQVSFTTKAKKRAELVKPYLRPVFDFLKNIPKGEDEKLSNMQGKSVEKQWLRHFQKYVFEAFPEYCPPEFKEWLDSQDETLQEFGQLYGESVEKKLRTLVLTKMPLLFGDNWALQIDKIQIDCQKKLLAKKKRMQKEGQVFDGDWLDMLEIKHLKSIIEKYWTKKSEEEDYRTFKDDLNFVVTGYKGKGDKAPWLSDLCKLRAAWAEGGAEVQLTKDEVDLLTQLDGILK